MNERETERKGKKDGTRTNAKMADVNPTSSTATLDVRGPNGQWKGTVYASKFTNSDEAGKFLERNKLSDINQEETDKPPNSAPMNYITSTATPLGPNGFPGGI